MKLNLNQSYFLLPRHLLDIHRRTDDTEGQAIGLGHAIHIICRDHRTAAGHVLHDKRRIARHIFPPMLSNQPRPQIKRSARGKANANLHGLALVKCSLGRNRRNRD